MKPLFLSIAIVGAISLWYSNAHAFESRHSQRSHYSHQVQGRDHHQAGHGYGHQVSNSRHSGWSNNGRGYEGGRSHREGEAQRGSFRHTGYEANVNNRQREQRERIRQAGRAGDLTGNERRALWAEQHQIAAEEHSYRADGRLSGTERADLQRDLTLASQHIYNESRDNDRRGDSRPDGDTRRDNASSTYRR